jgi:drug/metabolite transporter (DMT)-like permease
VTQTTSGIRQLGPRDIALVVLCATTFGSSFLFIDIIVGEEPLVTLACARSIILLLTLIVVLWLSGHRLPASGRIWGALVVLGMVGALIGFTGIIAVIGCGVPR